MEEGTDAGLGGGGVEEFTALELPPPPPLPMGGGFQPAVAPGFKDEHAGGPSSDAGGRGYQEIMPKTAYRLPERDTQVALRPGFGRIGRPVALYANHFAVKLLNSEDFYHYNVSIEPPVPNKKINRQVISKLRETFGQLEFRGKLGAYDGEKSLFTSGSLNFNSKEFKVYLEDQRGPSFRPGDRVRSVDSPPPDSPPDNAGGGGDGGKRRRTTWGGRDFVVTIVFAARVSMKPLAALLEMKPGPQAQKAEAALRVLDVVLREVASSRNYLLVRENFFHPDLGQVARLGEGVDGWRGFHSSIRPTNKGLSLNLDVTMTCVLEPVHVVDFLEKHFNVRSIEEIQGRDWRKAKMVLKNVRIETTHMRTAATHKIAGFSDEPISALSFPKKVRDGDGNIIGEEQISVEEHYHKVYALRLKYPHLPALDVGRKKKPTYIPLELCKILPGQRYTKTLSKGQRQKQIDACKQTPQERKSICERAMEVNKYDNDPLINEFGMKFNPELTKVNGRVLDPPQLEFGRGRTEMPRDGRWNFNNKTMQSGCTIENWAVAVFDDRCRDADNVARQLVQCCNTTGMEMSPPAGIEKEPHMAANATSEIRVQNMLTALRRYKPTFILVILPMDAKKDEIYVQFKKKCEQMIGVVSQCMVKPRNLNIQYLANLALKINLKMGGYNSPLSEQMSKFLGGPTIIFGMDVSHGSPGDADSPSVAAVVATKGWPKVSGMFSSQARTQAAKLEMIEGLCDENGDGMVKDAIMEFYQSCHKSIPTELRKPSQIIIYRDGVSEGQFKQCLDLELNAFKTACEKLPGNYNPKITFIIAQKRHSTRFFPARQGQGECMRNGNVIPGTVVDKDVCHPFNYDFFLSAHAGLIGTTRPTHYHVLHNENRFTPDELQQLTNNLCYTFARCSTAIGIAAPAAYAHLVATRFRKFVDSDMGSDTNSSLGSSRAGSKPAKEFGKCRISKDMNRFPMYFC